MRSYYIGYFITLALLGCPYSFVLGRDYQTAQSVLGQIDTPDVRDLCGMVFDESKHRVILFGGGFEGVLYDDTWSYDYSTNCWKRIQTDIHPSARNSFSMVYDSTNQVIILFGGHDGSSWIGDTWVFDCVNDEWTQLSPTTAPSPRGSTGMVYDSTNNKVILFSGYSQESDTWGFDYSSGNWTELNPSLSPGARYGHCMVFDEIKEKTLLFSGNSLEGMRDDLWEYDYSSNTWIELAQVTHPLGRKWGCMIYDSTAQESILFGGDCNDPEFSNDTWTYNSTSNDWNEQSQTISPDARASAAMVYDSTNQKTILFGGRGKNPKLRMLKGKMVNISMGEGISQRVEILEVIENPASVDFNRRGVITKGAFLRTELGRVRVTSRPGRDGIINGILIKD